MAVSRRWVLGGGLAVAVAGCGGLDSNHEVRFDGVVSGERGEFVMDGRVYVSGGTAPAENFRNVSVGLYDGDGELMDRVVLGDMSAYGDFTGERRVNISREYRPAFVVIESPGFWDSDSDVAVVAFHWSTEQGAYEQYSVSSADEKFEVD